MTVLLPGAVRGAGDRRSAGAGSPALEPAVQPGPAPPGDHGCHRRPLRRCRGQRPGADQLPAGAGPGRDRGAARWPGPGRVLRTGAADPVAGRPPRRLHAACGVPVGAKTGGRDWPAPARPSRCCCRARCSGPGSTRWVVKKARCPAAPRGGLRGGLALAVTVAALVAAALAFLGQAAAGVHQDTVAGPGGAVRLPARAGRGAGLGGARALAPVVASGPSCCRAWSAFGVPRLARLAHRADRGGRDPGRRVARHPPARGFRAADRGARPRRVNGSCRSVLIANRLPCRTPSARPICYSSRPGVRAQWTHRGGCSAYLLGPGVAAAAADTGGHCRPARTRPSRPGPSAVGLSVPYLAGALGRPADQRGPRRSTSRRTGPACGGSAAASPTARRDWPAGRARGSAAR